MPASVGKPASGAGRLVSMKPGGAQRYSRWRLWLSPFGGLVGEGTLLPSRREVSTTLPRGAVVLCPSSRAHRCVLGEWVLVSVWCCALRQLHGRSWKGGWSVGSEARWS